MARQLVAQKADVTPGAFGTKELSAWRALTLGHVILNWQSLSPAAAGPHAPFALPKEAIDKARGHFEEATKVDPSYGDAWAALAVTQALLGSTSNAWKSLGKATALGAGGQPTAVRGACFVRMREGRFDEAAK